VKRRKFLKSSAMTATAAATVSTPASSFFNLGLMPRNSSVGGYAIQAAALFDGTSGYLSRTPSSAGSAHKFTLSVWVKRSKITDQQAVISSRLSTGYSLIDFNSTDQFRFVDGDVGYGKQPLAQCRDTAGWYHLVYALDISNGTQSNRSRVYINGVEISDTEYGGTALTGSACFFNQLYEHRIGQFGYLGSKYHNGYMADFHWIDGLTLDCTSFGEFDSETGRWVPKQYAGTYGTNGFHLDFSNSGNLGEDKSGNANNWTVNGGVTQVTGGPADYGAIWSYISPHLFNNGMNETYSNGGRQITASGPNPGGVTLKCASTHYIDPNVPTYFEVDHSCTTFAGGARVGVANDSWDMLTDSYATTNCWYMYVNSGGFHFENGGTATASNVGSAINTTWCFAVSGSKLWMGYRSGGLTNWIDSAGAIRTTDEPGSSTNPTYANLSGAFYLVQVYISHGTGDSDTVVLNSTSDLWAASAPSGFKPLTHSSYPVPVISNPSEHFSTVTYAGAGGTQSVAGLNFQPDLVWIKRRSPAASHAVFDSVRGANLRMETDGPAAEILNNNSGYLTSFDSSGFSLQIGSSDANATHTSGDEYVAWCWKAGGATTVTNNDGSIESQVSANVTAGFSILSYTGNDSSASVGHGLSQPPEFIVIKCRDAINGTQGWQVWHKNLSSSNFLQLNDTALGSESGSPHNRFESPYSDSSVIYIGGNDAVNGPSSEFVSYCWHSVQGFSKFGSYVGNLNSDGSFVYLGFRPAMVIFKKVGTGPWLIMDSKRDPYNVMVNTLDVNTSNAELGGGNGNGIDFLSNGFKLRTATGGRHNDSGSTYIYAAFAEVPFKYANAK
jgi:hypothetical protein